MKLMVIGKYPPIEGGVSATTYWTCQIMAELGHEVHVVTNASEVEPQYQMWIQDEDQEMLQPDFTEVGGGRVVVYHAMSMEKRSYIPWANPYVTKLAGLALTVGRSQNCDMIYAHYLEPYGVAANIASTWLDIPYRVRHAGSDIGRLALIPELGEVYREVLGRAEKVITTPRHKERLERLGAKPNSFLFDRAFSIPTPLFNPKAKPLNIQELVVQTEQWCGELNYPSQVRERLIQINGREMDFSLPFIGVYGKVGETKGSFDLLAALTKCQGANLVAMVNGPGPQFLRFLEMIEAEDLANRVAILPFLPHWRVPSFIRACRVVCFLERRFPITFHTPTIPREVLACEVCLVCSQEIAGKLSFASNIADWKNIVVVDPENHRLLGESLQRLIDDKELARAIGYHGYNLSQFLENWEGYQATREELFSSPI